MSTRREELRAEIERFAETNPTGFAAEILAAGERAIVHHVDRAVLWDAATALRDIDLRWWRGQPDAVAAVKAARRAVRDADTAMARELRRERAAAAPGRGAATDEPRAEVQA